ncbi:MAG TPA: DUF1622 domain-containing protein [Candidatus Agathobaculum pullistercoris]|nr:DUF1622 domain-containing protein [uncultured Agathobaculum sp.]HIX11806.1 DUF1622 domain-containing protein [Candidatus Agathobaculum pullistercoris]
MEGLHTALSLLTGSAILLFEYTGVGVIIATGIMGIMRCLRRDPATRLQLAKGMALGLEFKLGSEILRTVIVREFREIWLVGAIILLRASLTLLIHWEITNEERTAETTSPE